MTQRHTPPDTVVAQPTRWRQQQRETQDTAAYSTTRQAQAIRYPTHSQVVKLGRKAAAAGREHQKAMFSPLQKQQFSVNGVVATLVQPYSLGRRTITHTPPPAAVSLHMAQHSQQIGLLLPLMVMTARALRGRWPLLVASAAYAAVLLMLLQGRALVLLMLQGRARPAPSAC